MRPSFQDRIGKRSNIDSDTAFQNLAPKDFEEVEMNIEHGTFGIVGKYPAGPNVSVGCYRRHTCAEHLRKSLPCKIVRLRSGAVATNTDPIRELKDRRFQASDSEILALRRMEVDRVSLGRKTEERA